VTSIASAADISPDNPIPYPIFLPFILLLCWSC